ncbi:uncharacterized protein [Drosophila tropicalis]|uniref:uncharacterized protein isoform X4 n=1 Tax=Drosophila tropicalis TaxID=46794 RepID=UPI0035ABB443
MVLRSGIIIPFQFRDTKKLLMIGVTEENRNLNIWDLKNVVRAAFGIYNFEFRNKKIGFNIPDELLLHYLAQRHDLTNFVIEISQENIYYRRSRPVNVLFLLLWTMVMPRSCSHMSPPVPHQWRLL